MGIARSTYYFELNKNDAVASRNKDLMDKIQEIFDIVFISFYSAGF